MRGRPNGFKRVLLWKKTRERYARRRHRYYRSGKNALKHQRNALAKSPRTPKWVLLGAGFVQPHLREISKKQPAGVVGPTIPFHTWNVTPAKRRVPKRVWSTPSLRMINGNPHTHARQPFIGFAVRRMLFRGKKVGRLKGDRWKAAAAWRYWLAVGKQGFPAWDPDGRLPVFP